ncbi:MAG: hypothetical protein U0168_03205 [Nannocystaceae bacterium]
MGRSAAAQRSRSRLTDLQRCGALGQGGDALAQALERAAQAAAHGGLGQAQGLRQLDRGHLLPVVQLERDLIVERQLPQRQRQDALLGPRGRDVRRRLAQIGHALLFGIEAVGVAAAAVEVLEQHVARDGEEVRAEAGVLAEAFATADATQHRLLHEIVDAVADLVAEEAVQRLEVTVEQRVAGVLVACTPAIEQLEIGLHRRRW